MAKKKNFPNTALGGRFKSLCFVGLNRVEIHISGNDEPLFGEYWQDVTDDQSRKNMAMCFFAPREIGSEDQDPYLYLAADAGHTPEEQNEARTVTKQVLGDQPLIDLNKFSEESANVVHFVVVADVLFHWDSKGAYIQPTNQQTWVRDLQQLIKSYPRQSKMTLYTEWESEKLAELKIDQNPIRALPLSTEAWINMPTFQEKYGMLTLVAGIAVAGAAFGGLNLQQQTIKQLSGEIQQIESRMPKVANLRNLNTLLEHQENQMTYRNLLPLIIKDVAYSIQTTGMNAESLEIKNPNIKKAPRVMIAEIGAKRNAYQGWLQEEPIAKGLLSHSTALEAIRKPPSGGKFKLEGLIDVRKFEKLTKELLKSEGLKSLDDLNKTEEEKASS
jgi:hypothetical protein